MPLFYTDVPGATITSNATPGTANDCFFIKSGSARTVWLNAIYLQGRGASLTSIYGITVRLEKWTTTAASGGSAITPSPNDPGYQAAKHTAGFGATVTSGTGGPTLMLAIGCGATSPFPWVNPQGPSDQSYALEAGATQSLDLFNVCGVASVPFEVSTGTVE